MPEWYCKRIHACASAKRLSRGLRYKITPIYMMIIHDSTTAPINALEMSLECVRA